MKYRKFEKNRPPVSNHDLRISGRVGVMSKALSFTALPFSQNDSDEMIALYQRLFRLNDKRESELSKAISYGLKIMIANKSDRGTRDQIENNRAMKDESASEVVGS